MFIDVSDEQMYALETRRPTEKVVRKYETTAPEESDESTSRSVSTGGGPLQDDGTMNDTPFEDFLELEIIMGTTDFELVNAVDSDTFVSTATVRFCFTNKYTHFYM